MKYSLVASSLWAAGVLAMPAWLAPRQTTNIDPTVLQFALTLEHLENAFYKGALAKFSLKDFEDAGYSATYYNNLKYIAYDEQSHVQLLSSALSAAGVTPVAPCQYSFPYTDVASFITLSSVLEGVGTSAYLAGAPLITDKGYLTVAGSILVTEALHTSYQRAAIGEVPMANAYGTPLDPTSVYTLAAAFITSCPSGNAPLPFVPFPALAYNSTASCTCEGPDCSPSAAIRRRSESWANWSAPQGDNDAHGAQETGSCSHDSGSENSGHGSGSDSDSEDQDSGYEHSGAGKTVEITKTETVSGKVVTKTETAVIVIKTDSGKPVTVTEAYTKPAQTLAVTKTESVSGKAYTKTEAAVVVTKTESGKLVTVTEAATKTSHETEEASKASHTYTKGTATPSPSAYCAPPSAGGTIVLTAAGPIPAGSYVTFLSGLDVVSVQGQISGSSITVTIPAVAMGQTYVLLTSADNEKTLNAASVLFGPAIVEVHPAAPAV